MNEEKTANLGEMIGNYVALARKALRFWRRAVIVAVVVAVGGLWWVMHRPRVFKSEASATVQDVRTDASSSMSPDEAQAELRARLDQVYGSRGNLGRVVDELNLYPWLRGRTSRLKVIGSFQDAITYSVAGRDAFHLEFVYQDPAIARRVVERLLQLFTAERRAAGESQTRNDLTSVDTAIAGLETVLSDQEEHLGRFERANHDMVEQVRLRRMGQMVRAGLDPSLAVGAGVSVSADPLDSARTRHLRIRLSGLSARAASLQRALTAPAAPAPVAAPVEESERLQALRHTVTDLRERLARLRTTYTEEYPDVQITARRLADAERELATAVAAEHPHTHAATVDATASPESLRSQLASISAEMDQTRSLLTQSSRDDHAHAPPVQLGNARPAPVPDPAPAVATDRLSSLVEVESMWDRLTGEATATRTRYQQLLTRKFELQAMLETVSNSHSDVLRVIDPPTLPAEPEPPGRTKMGLMVLAAALALALGIAALSGFLDGRVYEPADLRRWGELPELPPIPDLTSSFGRRRPSPRAATARSSG